MVAAIFLIHDFRDRIWPVDSDESFGSFLVSIDLESFPILISIDGDSVRASKN